MPDAMNGGIDMVADNRVIGVSPVSRLTVTGPISVTGPITRAIGRGVAVAGTISVAISWVTVAGPISIAVCRIAVAICRIAVAITVG
jgi:hypothetical protein